MRKFLNGVLSGALSLLFAQIATAAEPDAKAIEFFEARIRPVLIDQCQDCHNSVDTAEGDLTVDHRAGLLRGGQSGPAVVPGQPEQSLLIKVLRHELDGLDMPQGADKLSDVVIKDFERWIRRGAVDPREPPTGTGELATTWDAEFQQRLRHWCFQPISEAAQEFADNADSRFVDSLILRQIQEAGLDPADRADDLILLRRACFVLTGLPPTEQQIHVCLSHSDDSWFETVVDELIASPQFGEHWARHWMDWIRYAETHGSEGDPSIPYAWQYRDYLIRALNADVPYDQLLREHIAGDLLPQPRIGAESGLNESVLGTSHWRMVFHGFAPTDALDEKVRFTDDQINVFSQAFLGLTVSCARCHNHKFDPISQTDYYALFGILGSCRPGILDANPKEKRQRHQPELRDLKERIRAEVADAWSQAAKNLPERFVQDGQASELVTQAEDRTHPLHPLFLVQRERRKHPDQPFAEVWQSVRSQLPKPIEQSGDEILSWDLADSDANRWYADGNGLTSTGSPAGEFSVHVSGPSIISQVLPGGVYSHVLSTKHRGMFGSPRFHLDQDSDLWLLVAGDGGSQVRYVVQNYPRSGTVYPVRDLNGEQWQWIKYDLTYWTGDDIHVELTTAKDAPILVKENDRSWFGIRRVVLKPKGAAPPEDLQDEFLAQFQAKLLSRQVDSWEGAIDQWSRLLRESIDRWADGAASDADALLLEACRRTGLLPNDVGMGKRLGSKVTEYRRLESEIPLPVRVPGLWEADAKNQPLFVRGNHKQPANDVPRRFLSAFESAPFETLQSGRLQLAEELVSPDNPLVSRVIVNRIWHHLFGEGLVRTPDNFGELGERPTHPELLDALARRFQQHGWSLKRLIRELMLADAWQRSSTPSPLAKARDPENRLLSHAHVRPVEAESLRDAILAISGRLNPESYGPPAGINTEHPRRSVYTTIRRNSMNSFLETFNAPVPFTTKGKRDNTNVPAQSLTLLNAPFVINSARRAASQLKATTKHSKVEWVFLTSLNRPPSATEAKASLDFVDRLTAQYQQLGDQRNQIEEQIAKLEQERREILEPIRLRLCQDRSSTETSLTAALEPIAVWDFEAGPVDSISGKDGQIHGTAKIADGSLHLDGQGHFASPPLNQEIGERTLEAWVQLANLDQRGGGVVSLQNLRGDIFDAIVFGEQSPREWLAGSNVFARTRPFQGSTETKAQERPVHLVLTYSADGTITCYRDGVLYGQPYNPGSLMTFAKGDAQILLGLRHGTPGGNRLLSGKIYEARLYDRALNAEEVAASASGNHLFVSRREILASCSEAQRRRLEELEMKTVQFREQRKTLPASIDDHQPWADLIHAVWNLKEFRYLR